MGNGLDGSVLDSSERGVTGTHPDRQLLRVLAAPGAGDEKNTIRAALFPIACWRAEDANFEFDSSFIQPEMRGQMQRLKQLLDGHPNSPVSLFGHADPVGNDEFNKALSGRRAIAVHALVTRQVEKWEPLFITDHWGNRGLTTMLQTVNAPQPSPSQPGTGDPTSAPAELTFSTSPRGNASGGGSASATASASPSSTSGSPPAAPSSASPPDNSPPPTELVKQFQREHGLAPDGALGPQTRKALFAAYMDVVCVGADDKPFSLTTGQFLGRGADPGGKGDLQGCGEFNPVLMFSAEEQKAFEQDQDKTTRNRENAPNRRVLALLFRPEAKINTAKWPCPRVTEGTAGCRLRFWSDAALRRRVQENRRKYEDTHDTFACRFYDRLNAGSPCEKVVPGPPGICFVFLKVFDGLFETALVEKPYTLRGLQRNTSIKGTTDAEGVLRHEQLPDDHYELDCEGATEIVEPFYMADMPRDDEPWFLRMRAVTVAAK